MVINTFDVDYFITDKRRLTDGGGLGHVLGGRASFSYERQTAVSHIKYGFANPKPTLMTRPGLEEWPGVAQSGSFGISGIISCAIIETMVLPELPQELWDSIIDQLHDDKHTLASCSYVCKGFHSTAQKIFYEHTTLSLLSLTSFQLHNLLERSPYLRPYVRKLTITDHTRALWRRSDGIPESAQSVVASAVSLLDNVVSLSIERRLEAGPVMDWASWVPELKAALLDRCRLAQLVDLNLDHIYNVPFAIFDHIPTLKSLTLIDVWFPDHTETSPKNQHKSIAKLETLKIEYQGVDMSRPLSKWMRSANCTLDLTHLTKLSLHIEFGYRSNFEHPSGSVVPYILCQCSSSLQDLHYYNSLEADTTILLDLHTMLSLRRLSISAQIWNWRDVYNTTVRLRRLIDIVNGIPFPSHIGTISMLCDTIGYDDYEGWILWKLEGWPPSSALPAFLSAIMRLSQAASVKVVIRDPLISSTPVRQYFEEQLAPLLERRILRITS
ncbi:hypothetical protein B0H34DRAFT_798024 [Crassisporium funariophilum]|nr:hypothetical protein B0H34DRAFT_798024 [Crassisporium funariophilum]